MPLICVRGFEIDPVRRCVRGDGRTIEPTDQEFRLLYFLAKSTDVVFSREVLLAEIWRNDTLVTVRSIDTLIKRLRQRVESDPARPRFLVTVWGVGYKFAGD
jgi:DNA-binding response OmpR family regulator